MLVWCLVLLGCVAAGRGDVPFRTSPGCPPQYAPVMSPRLNFTWEEGEVNGTAAMLYHIEIPRGRVDVHMSRSTVVLDSAGGGVTFHSEGGLAFASLPSPAGNATRFVVVGATVKNVTSIQWSHWNGTHATSGTLRLSTCTTPFVARCQGRAGPHPLVNITWELGMLGVLRAVRFAATFPKGHLELSAGNDVIVVGNYGDRGVVFDGTVREADGAVVPDADQGGRFDVVLDGHVRFHRLLHTGDPFDADLSAMVLFRWRFTALGDLQPTAHGRFTFRSACDEVPVPAGDGHTMPGWYATLVICILAGSGLAVIACVGAAWHSTTRVQDPALVGFIAEDPLVTPIDDHDTPPTPDTPPPFYV